MPAGPCKSWCACQRRTRQTRPRLRCLQRTMHARPGSKGARARRRVLCAPRVSVGVSGRCAVHTPHLGRGHPIEFRVVDSEENLRHRARSGHAGELRASRGGPAVRQARHGGSRLTHVAGFEHPRGLCTALWLEALDDHPIAAVGQDSACHARRAIVSARAAARAAWRRGSGEETGSASRSWQRDARFSPTPATAAVMPAPVPSRHAGGCPSVRLGPGQRFSAVAPRPGLASGCSAGSWKKEKTTQDTLHEPLKEA